MKAAVLARLEAFQRELSAVLRAPLDRSGAVLRADPARYPVALRDRVRATGVASDERLAVYNRQYWFRLFGVLQTDYPLTTALLGAWTFNDLAARYLEAHPPTGHELGTLSQALPGYARDWVRRQAPPIPADALLDAIDLDRAFHRARTAPVTSPLRMTPAEAPRLASARLIRSPAFSIVRERRPLVAVRRGLPTPLGDHRARVPAPHPDGAKPWLVGRSPGGIRAVPLAPPQAELLDDLAARSLGESLARLEHRHGDQVIGGVQRWLADAMELGVWTALEDAAP